MMKVMEFIGYPEMIFAAVCFLSLHHLRSKIKTLPTNWPLLGMLPSLLINLPRFHCWATDILSSNACTFVFKGPWFTNMNHMVITSDPANMRHIFNTNFSNYPKGAEFNEFFDILGDGIFNADLDSWKTQRKMAHHFITDKKFQRFLVQTSVDKVKSGLIPVLEHVLEQNMVVDLQDLLKRFTFDTTLVLLSGIDPCCLAIEFNKFPYVDALDDAEEAIFHRHVIPVNLWKLQRFLGIGKEKKLSKAKEKLDQFIARCISTKRELQLEHEEKGVDLLASYMEHDDGSISDIFFRDTIINFLVAGRSTLSAALTWFFWLVSNNPIVEAKLIEELKKAISSENEDKKVKMFDTEYLKGLVYLHGALCEALRLFPSVPFEHKRPLNPDILPSGHKVDSKTKILPLLYSMGRMEVIWGKDCLEFKPERWITGEGRIKYVPSYKFMAFNSGPRTCLGKEIAFTQMRMVVATILYNYHVQVVQGQPISPKNSIILYMSHGMKVRIKRRV
ncbi:alkane hydroxylase MAH1-like [Thalictrum thalictroides]|uniref:Alkane hydroxylase MAH1-like n=1 Tax=Thalictrum thalictroides TaxID=46969 RepID=A0A7J6WBM6_THATH|nr:alkane hydroxylase MAH1-like [Thalictrum thalictroides]